MATNEDTQPKEEEYPSDAQLRAVYRQFGTSRPDGFIASVRAVLALLPAEKTVAAVEQTRHTDDFITRTNTEYAAWCSTFYAPEALDHRGMASLHGLWAWQEQERRMMSRNQERECPYRATEGRICNKCGKRHTAAQLAAGPEPVKCGMRPDSVWKTADNGQLYQVSNFSCNVCGYVGQHDAHPGCRKAPINPQQGTNHE